MSASPELPWPEGREGAVSMTFDDGMKSQLQRAIPYMDKLGLRGTFYVNPKGDLWLEQLKPWREVAARGHEIGNHTCGHPCSRNFTGAAKGLETMSLAEVEADILEAERRLNEAIPEHGPRSFCYPCYNHHVGEGPGRQSYVPVVARRFIAGRGGSVSPAYHNHPAVCDLHLLESATCQRMSGPEMIGLCEAAAMEGRWCVLTFHGVLEGHLGVNEVDLRRLCDYLARRKDRLYVAPVVEVAQVILDWREGREP